MLLLVLYPHNKNIIHLMTINSKRGQEQNGDRNTNVT